MLADVAALVVAERLAPLELSAAGLERRAVAARLDMLLRRERKEVGPVEPAEHALVLVGAAQAGPEAAPAVVRALLRGVL